MNIRQQKYKQNLLLGMSKYSAARAAGYAHNYATQAKRIDDKIVITAEDIINSPNCSYKKPDKNRVRYVYILQVDGFDYYKIGTSVDVTRRVHDIQAHNPFELKIIYVKEGSLAVESQIHNLMEEKRVRNEWFQLTKDELRIVTEIVDECKATEV